MPLKIRHFQTVSFTELSNRRPHRPDRIEPRAKKRRPKNYRLLTKPRREMGPLPHRKIGVENTPKSPLS
jgi:hypothetical protein